MEARDPRVEGGDEPVRDTLRRPIHAGALKGMFEPNRLTHKKSDTPWQGSALRRLHPTTGVMPRRGPVEPHTTVDLVHCRLTPELSRAAKRCRLE